MKTAETSPEMRSGRAYREIRRRILASDLPPGAPLSEYQLASDLQISRTPIREALKALAQEGLVTAIPPRGMFVSTLTGEDLMEIYQLREQLEGFAASVAAALMEDDEIRRLRAAADAARVEAAKGNTESALAADLQLHRRIIEVTRNRRLMQFLATMDDQIHRITALVPRSPERLAATFDEHARILDAITQRDGPAAEQAMRAHQRAARDYALRLVAPSLLVASAAARTDDVGSDHALPVTIAAPGRPPAQR